MIKLANDTLLVNERDGSETAFDASELENRLRRCFSAAGFGGNGYLAEDIAMAVEFSLRTASEPERQLNIEELDNVVLTVLHDAGFDDVATLFQAKVNNAKLKNTEPEDIETLLQKSMGFANVSIPELAAQTSVALKKLDLNEISAALIVELARHMPSIHEGPASLIAAPVMPVNKLYCVSPDSMASGTSVHLKRLLDTGVIKFGGIRRTFKAIQLRVDLYSFVKSKAIELPTTELELFPHLADLSQALLECVLLARKHYFRSTLQDEEALPLCVTLNNPDKFALDALAGCWPESKKAIKEIMLYVLECAATPAYQIKYESTPANNVDIPLK